MQLMAFFFINDKINLCTDTIKKGTELLTKKTPKKCPSSAKCNRKRPKTAYGIRICTPWHFIPLRTYYQLNFAFFFLPKVGAPLTKVVTSTGHMLYRRGEQLFFVGFQVVEALRPFPKTDDIGEDLSLLPDKQIRWPRYTTKSEPRH